MTDNRNKALDIGYYVEILPQTDIDRSMKDMGFPNNGIVVSLDENNGMVEVWRNETAKLGLTMTQKVNKSEIVLLKGKDDENRQRSACI